MKAEVKDFVVKQLAIISTLANVHGQLDILQAATKAFVAITLDRIDTDGESEREKP